MTCAGWLAAIAAFIATDLCAPQSDHEILDSHGLTEGVVLHSEVELSIYLVNKLLEPLGRFAVKAHWHSAEDAGAEFAEEVIDVYLADRAVSAANRTQRIKQKLEQIQEARRLLWQEINVDQSGEEPPPCEPLQPCAHRPSTADPYIQAIANVLNRFAVTENAAADANCRCIILIESDLLIFDQVFAHDIENQQRSIGIEVYIPYLILHEIGHLRQNFSLPAHLGNASADRIWSTVSSEFTSEQIEELRADAFAVATLREACFRDDVDLQGFEKSNPCIAPLAHGSTLPS